MKRHLSLSFASSLCAIVCYLACTLLAFAHYPLPYSPLNNWLSDLGNPDLNPAGALFYNMGIVVTAAILLLFFLGLSRWKMENNQTQRLMLLITQGTGMLGAFAMLMSGLYPINSPALHSFFSICLYILLGTAFAFAVAALRYHAACPRWLLIVFACTALEDILSGVFHTVTVFEWVTIALLLCSTGLLGVETKRLAATRTHRSPTAAIT